MSEIKVTCDLKRLRRSYWDRDLSGLFCLDDGTELGDGQVRKIVEYAIEHGYRTESDIPESEIKGILGLNDDKR